jgi:uncharacterized membrane protein YiaA
MKNVGIVLLIVGLVMMLYTGFNYVTEKRVVDIGPIKVDKEQTHHAHWSPIIGVALLLSGVIVIVFNKKKTG